MASRMTTNHKLLIVLGLLAAIAGVKMLWGERLGETGESVQASQALFADVKKDDLTAVVIEAPEGKKHELVKEGDHWKVASEGNARADQTDVNKVLDAIVRLKQGRVISSSGDKPATYGLDEAKRTTVKAWGKEGRSGPPVAAFSIGKVEGDWRNSFLQLPDKREIRKVEGTVSDFEPGSDNTWRDKTMYSEGTADAVERIEIAGPQNTIVLARRKEMGPKEPAGDATDPETTGDEPGTAAASGDAANDGKPEGEQEVKETYWVLEAPADAVPNAAEPPRAKKWLCDSIAGYVAKLECDSFGADTDKASEVGLDPPQYRIRATRAGETEPKDVLFLGEKNKDGKYAAKLPDPNDPQIWWIAGWKGDYLTKTVEDLLETPPAKPEEKPAEEDADPPAEGTETTGEDAQPPAEDAKDEPASDETPAGDDAKQAGDAEPAGDAAATPSDEKPAHDAETPEDEAPSDEEPAARADGGDSPR